MLDTDAKREMKCFKQETDKSVEHMSEVRKQLERKRVMIRTIGNMRNERTGLVNRYDDKE